VLDDILSRLQHRALEPGHWIARCPCPGHASGDRRPSLDIRRAGDGLPLVICRSLGHRYPEVLAALGLGSFPGAPPYVAPPVDEWEAAHRLALEMAARQGWWTPELIELRAWRGRIADLHAAAERLGPDDPAAWAMLATASALEHELCLLDTIDHPDA
jgi:hypothetical protein